MDENNLNPNGENNNPLQGNDPYNMNSNPYQNQDPYASMNPDFNQAQDPYASMNSDFNQGQDPYASMNPDFNQAQDPYASMNSDFNQGQDSYGNMNANPNSGLNNSQVQPTSNINDFDDSNQVLNPILNQNLPNNNVNQVDGGVTDSAPTLPGQDFDTPQVNDSMNYQDNNNFNDPNMNYQDNNNFADPNMNYQANNYTDPNMNANQNFNQNFGNNNSSGDYNMDFVKTWMGTIYDKAHSSKFNWCAALLGEIYLLYRKMYLTGSLLAVLRLLFFFLSIFIFTKVGVVGFILLGIVFLAFFVGCGLGFYPLYRNFVKNNLNKLKQTITDNSQLVNLASQKGNTSVIAVVIYCVVVPIIVSALLAILASAKIIDFTLGFIGSNNEIVNQVNNEVDENFDYKLLEFTDGYSIEYDSLTWFYNDTDKSLTKGDYVLLYTDQAISDIKSAYNFDVTNANDRSALLNSLISSFESQVASLNLSAQAGTSNFVTGTSIPNVYYSYIDIESAEALTRYYLILLPEDDILFQFTLNANDTTVDNITNADVISILTSATKVEDSDLNEESDNTNTIGGNGTNDNTVENGSNIVSNEVALNETNVVSDNTVANNEVVSNAVNENTTNSNLGEFLR